MKTEEREALRRKVRYFYDLQKVRIQLGNRTDDPDLYVLKKDAHTGKDKKVKKKTTKAQAQEALQSLANRLASKPREVNPDEAPAPLVLDEEDRLFLRRQNILLESLENDTLDRIEDVIETQPVYRDFLKPVKGCGPTMSAVILSEVQMAVQVDPDILLGEDILRKEDVAIEDVNGEKWSYVYATHLVKTEKKPGKEDPEGTPTIVESEVLRKYFWKGKDLYHDMCPTVSALWSYAGIAVDTQTGLARRRTKGQRFNWNPFLKTKVLGVLADCMIKAKPEKYREIYDNYKHRKESAGWGRSKAHRHRAAIRVMMKAFLADLWNFWRAREGFPVVPPYSEAMLGRKHGDHGGVVG